MHADSAAVTTEVPQLNLPAELLTELKRGGKSKTDFGVAGMAKPSLMDRLLAKLLGDRRA